MSIYCRMVLIAFTASLAACNEHTALNATVDVDLPPQAITSTTVELILAGAEVIAPDGQRSDPANSGTLLLPDTQRVALSVCKGTPHAAVSQTLLALQARKVKVAVISADPARCG